MILGFLLLNVFYLVYSIQDKEGIFMIYSEDISKEDLVNKHKIRFDKIKKYFLEYLEKNNFNKAIMAVEEAHTYHNGFRKDGAPEFMHQLEICLFLTTLPQLPKGQDLEDFFCAAILHDLREDYGVSDEYIRQKYGNRVADLVELLTKVFNGVKKTDQEYFLALRTDPLAALIKLADRFHNVSTMSGAFTYSKQRGYIQEVKELFYPLMKGCLKDYPEYNLSFYTLKRSIEVLCQVIQSSLLSLEEGSNLKTEVSELRKMKK